LIGIAVDITEQRASPSGPWKPICGYATPSRPSPKPFVLWDAEDRLVLCNSHFQRLHRCRIPR